MSIKYRLYSKKNNDICGVMVSVLTSSAVDVWSSTYGGGGGQTKEYNIGILLFLCEALKT